MTTTITGHHDELVHVTPEDGSVIVHAETGTDDCPVALSAADARRLAVALLQAAEQLDGDPR